MMGWGEPAQYSYVQTGLCDGAGEPVHFVQTGMYDGVRRASMMVLGVSCVPT